jgi:hypothetical protein
MRGPLQALCPECGQIRCLQLTGNVSVVNRGCDSCAHGRTLAVSLAFYCPEEHLVWNAEGTGYDIVDALKEGDTRD